MLRTPAADAVYPTERWHTENAPRTPSHIPPSPICWLLGTPGRYSPRLPQHWLFSHRFQLLAERVLLEALRGAYPTATFLHTAPPLRHTRMNSLCTSPNSIERVQFGLTRAVHWLSAYPKAGRLDLASMEFLIGVGGKVVGLTHSAVFS